MLTDMRLIQKAGNPNCFQLPPRPDAGQQQ